MTDPIDYTSRDYEAIRTDLLAAAGTKLPEWTSRSPNDFGVVMVELFASMGDVLNYYADRIANEAYLSTATQRSSVLEIADLLDYRPSGNAAASVLLTLTNSTGSPTTVLKRVQVSTNSPTYTAQIGTVARSGGGGGSRPQIVFELDSDVVVPAHGSATVTATEGRTVGNEDLGTSSGAADQAIHLSQGPVIDGSVSILVDEGAGALPWTYLEHLIDADTDDAAYTLKVDANLGVTVLFGDGVNGRVPAQGAVLYATYRVGGGSDGNVGPGTVTRVVSAGPGGIRVTNGAAAFGGSDAESMDSIRKNAPRSLFALNRAVSLKDYEFLARRVPQVGKARATSSVYSSVVVAVAPTGGGGLDSSGNPTKSFAAVKTAVADFLSDKCPASVTVTIVDPVYVPINVTVSIHVGARYRQATTIANAKTALNTLLAFKNVAFGDRITVSDVYTALSTVPGVDYSAISVLSRTSTGAADVQLADGEIPTATNAGASTVTVTATGGIV